ncbi:chemotaxis protein CheB [Sphingomonas citricola]|uniref:chemotaxis protein CheB n=1 Tax=Sphingomonas citricola TaxID=2862498 RepID=UPI0027E3C0DF|nr:chemotaxis protein CheB [Sphingomonas citricola]
MPPPSSLARVMPGRALPRVVIIDDSAVARAAMSRIIVDSARYSVTATCASASQALTLLKQTSVDLILLDIEMPHTSGLAALPELLRIARDAKVLIVSGSAGEGAAHAVEALALGAADTLVKPIAGTIGAHFGDALLARLDALSSPDLSPPPVARAAPRPAYPFDVVAIGASTGGIHALTSVLRAVPATMQRPIVVTQHLPSSFSAFFAAQITAASGRPCALAEDRMRLLPGHIVVAPGDAHVVAVPLGDGTAALRLSREAASTGNLPAVDPMFATLAAVYRERLLAVVLSGMGRDGLEGARAARAAGGTVVVQDRESSVVWGMPGSVAGAGLAHAVLTPAQIAGFIAANGRA